VTNSNSIKFKDADDSASVGIKAPSTVSGTYTLTLPAAVGSTSQALVTTDGSGTLGFTSTSSFGITTGKAIAMAIVFG
jgi:glycine cleavage system aminomethyltransferase T